MKKIFTLLALVCCSLSVLAEDYKCNLAVWVNNIAADPQQMNISATSRVMVNTRWNSRILYYILRELLCRLVT